MWALESMIRVQRLIMQLKTLNYLAKGLGEGNDFSTKTSTISTSMLAMLAWWIRPRDGVACSCSCW
jgi:hypothetical protein